jgi:hypothetical protein
MHEARNRSLSSSSFSSILRMSGEGRENQREKENEKE